MNFSRWLFLVVIISCIVICLANLSTTDKKRKKKKRIRKLLRLKELSNTDSTHLEQLITNLEVGNEDFHNLDIDLEKLKKRYRRRNRKNKVRKNKSRRRRKEKKKHKIHRQDLENLMSLAETAQVDPVGSEEILRPDEQRRFERQLLKELIQETKRRKHKKRSEENEDVSKPPKRHRRRDRLLQLPTRHRTYDVQGIPVGDIEPPLCPPSVGPVTSHTCVVPTCTTHRQCGQSLACCFNGCVHTCTTPMDRPPVIDWIEDTSDVKPIFEPDDKIPILPDIYKESSSLYESTGMDTVRLPGGCTISATEYQELKEFMEGPYIENCMCSGGEVACSVKPFKASQVSDGSR